MPCIVGNSSNYAKKILMQLSYAVIAWSSVIYRYAYDNNNITR
jgi:hypothetical protein